MSLYIISALQITSSSLQMINAEYVLLHMSRFIRFRICYLTFSGVCLHASTTGSDVSSANVGRQRRHGRGKFHDESLISDP